MKYNKKDEERNTQERILKKREQAKEDRIDEYFETKKMFKYVDVDQN